MTRGVFLPSTGSYRIQFSDTLRPSRTLQDPPGPSRTLMDSQDTWQTLEDWAWWTRGLSTFLHNFVCCPLYYWNRFWKRTKILFVFDYFDKNEPKRKRSFYFSKRINLNECICSNFQNEQTKTNAFVPNFKTNRLKRMHSFQILKRTD